jgi:hypothetical protein
MTEKRVLVFWSRVEKQGECLIWTRYCNEKGYPYFYDGKRMRRAHIVAYELMIGSVPEGLELDHLCRVRHCVNPDHLEAVTHRVNMLRSESPQLTGIINRSKTHCNYGHPFSGDNLYILKGGGRQCKICKSRRMKEYYLRQAVLQ